MTKLKKKLILLFILVFLTGSLVLPVVLPVRPVDILGTTILGITAVIILSSLSAVATL